MADVEMTVVDDTPRYCSVRLHMRVYVHMSFLLCIVSYLHTHARSRSFEGISSRNRATESWPWVEKYRPSSLSDLIAHQEIISTLNRLIDAQKLPHLLFYGPPGTGKTSMIIAAARRLYGKNYGSMVLELNASDDRGIDVVRNQIKEFAGTKKLFSCGVKLIILDEADSMTNDAQFSLRRGASSSCGFIHSHSHTHSHGCMNGPSLTATK